MTDDGVGHCSQTSSQPTVELSTNALGALYLGSTSARPLAATGHITGVTEAASLDQLFGWPVAAWCDEGF